MRRKTIVAGLSVLATALAVLAGVHLYPSSSPGAAASSTLTCSVKASCTGDEVAVFRMSGSFPPANAHAGTAGGSTYGNVVCCGGVAGLSPSCSGTFDTVLWLSALDNAHAAEASQTGYATQVCLSAPSDVMDCYYETDSPPPTCDAGYTCLATISGTTNAHVADCDGSNDYVTRVCCSAAELATPTPTATATPMATPTATPTGAGPVGGIAELPDIGGASAEEAGAPSNTSGWSAGTCAALAAGLAAAVAVIAGGAWYARRRWVR